MYGFLLSLIILDGLLLITVVLLQSGKGGGLAAMGGGAAATEGVLGGRQATTLLTRTTWVTGTIFLVLALVLSILSSRSVSPTSILSQGPATTTAPVAQPILPSTGGGEAPATGNGDAGSTGGDSGN